MSYTEIKQKPITLSAAKRMVQLTVSDENIFHFPEGVPAFEEYQRFVLFCAPDMQPFFQMKSVGISPEISFVCVDPFVICPDYKLRISKSDLKLLGLERAEDAFVFSLVTVSPDPQDITANLQGPMVINLKNCLGKQIICEGAGYPVRFRIWDALNQMEERPESPLCAVGG